MAIKRPKKSSLQEVNENKINPNEEIKSTKLVAENEKDCSVNSHTSKIIRKDTKRFIPIDEDDFESEEAKNEEKVELPPSSKRKIIGSGGRIIKPPVVEESELENDSDLCEEEDEVTPPLSSKRKVIGSGGRISKPPVVEESELENDLDLYEEKEEVTLPPSSKRKIIGSGGRIFKPHVVEKSKETSEIENNLDLEEEKEIIPPPSSKRKVIGGGKISKASIVEKSESSSVYSNLKDLEEDDEEDESFSYYLDKLHKDDIDEELEDTENEEELDFYEDELDIDDVSELDTYEDEEEANDDEKSEEDEIILKASKRKKSQLILNREQFSEKDIYYVSNIPIVPINIESYEKISITEKEAQIVNKFGIKSITIVDGEAIPVKVFGTKNSLAVLLKSEEHCFLQWIGDFVKLENKSKGTNGRVYVDVIVEDELSSKKITVPVSTLTDRYKIKTLSNYDIHVSPTDSITVAVTLKKILEKMPIHDKNKTLGVVVDTNSELGFSFNAYNSVDAFEIQNNCIDYDDYLENFNALLEKSVSLQFLISATMGAAILTILQEAFNYDLHSYCINIVV